MPFEELFPVALGGDGGTVTNDAAPGTGLLDGGHDPNFEYALGQFRNMLEFFTTTIVGGADTNGTSTSSVLVGTGTKSFTTQAGKSFLIGSWVQISSTAQPANYMVGQITGYNTGSGAMNVNVIWVYGSGTFASWNIMRISAPVPARAPVYTYAQMLALTPQAGDIVQVSDFGVQRTLWHYNGSLWLPASSRLVIASNVGSSLTPVSSVGGVTAAIFPVYPEIDTGKIRANSRILVRATFERGGGGTPSVSVYFGPAKTTADPLMGTLAAISGATGTTAELTLEFHIQTVGASGSGQASGVIANGASMSRSVTATRAVDTTVKNYVSVGFAGGLSGDVHNLLDLTVEYAP